MPIPLTKSTESTAFSADYIPTKSSEYHQQITEELAHIRGITAVPKKIKHFPIKRETHEYDNLRNMTKSRRKIQIEQKVLRDLLVEN